MEAIQFRNFIKLQRGFDLPKNNREEGEFPVIAATGINGFHSDYKAVPPGVTTGRSGSLGEVVFIDQLFWPLNTTLWVKDFKGNYPRYVYYFLKTLDLKKYNSGAGVPTLNRNHLDMLIINIHPLTTQHKIAAILSAYDDLIENNLRRIKILEEMAQLLYQEWFVKFRFPDHEKVKMVNGIPERWKIGKLEDVVTLQRGFDLPKEKRNQSGSIPVFAATGLNGTHDEAKVKGPGLVTGRSGSLGCVIYIDEDFWPLNTTLWGKDFPVGSPIFAYYVLSGIGLESYNSGAAVPTLNRNDIHGLPIVIPTSTVISLFENYVIVMRSQMRNLNQKIDVLRQTRDLLLPKLISGELDASDLDIAIPK